ncbi:MAG: glycosyltransferase family 2 protein [Methylophilus sp.]
MQSNNLSNNIQPLLTIAIPTFNRASCLDVCLKRLSDELDNLSLGQCKLVKVYVSNNASTDQSVHTLRKYNFSKAGGCEFTSNEFNIGGERNAIKCYESATTQYVWILGDDDVILPGGLKLVLDTLLLQQPDILYLGNYHFIESYLDQKCAIKPKTKAISICKNSLDFAKRTNVMLTFISALVIRKRVNQDIMRDVTSGTNLPQLGWILPLLIGGNNFVIIEDWVVAAKGGNSGGYSLIKVFGENLNMILNDILKNRPKEVNAILNGTIVNFFPGFLLEMRSGNSKFTDKDVTLGLKNVFDNNWRYYFFLYPLIKLPLFLAYRYNTMLNILRRLFGNYLI